MDKWKVSCLYYGDVLKWMPWFENRNQKYEEIKEVHECKEQEDCCDCENYISRGGKDFYDKMKDWLTATQSKIAANDSIIKGSIDCYLPSFTNRVALRNQVNNLGTFSPFASDYELGRDYTEYDQTVTIYDGNVIIRKKGNNVKGFEYDSTYLEKLYASADWDDYFAYWSSHNQSGLIKEYAVYGDNKFYMYDEDNVRFNGVSVEAVKQAYTKAHGTYTVIADNRNKYMAIQGEPYPIYKGEVFSGTNESNAILNKLYYIVYRVPFTNTPYINVNGSRVYAELGNDNKYRFIYNPNLTYDLKPSSSSLKEYVEYGGKEYLLTGNRLTIGGLTFNKVDGYFYSGDTILFTSGSSVYFGNASSDEKLTSRS